MVIPDPPKDSSMVHRWNGVEWVPIKDTKDIEDNKNVCKTVNGWVLTVNGDPLPATFRNNLVEVLDNVCKANKAEWPYLEKQFGYSVARAKSVVKIA